ncbi:MAG: A/G-specific adenine glycosylase [Fluviicola sp.]|nr:MAG: A/G-specific adenine glycosylase [Fluviicola sp.]
MHDFSLSIRLWYRQNKRNLPWRETKNPYLIWLSEIILQQTRVIQGKSYYLKFVNRYPEIEDLANAKEQEVLNLWQGLGYYSRARNLHFASKQVMEEFSGKFPSTYKDIKQLKGVGDYTASAIASFAFDLPHAVVDGNVYRVLSRYYTDETPIDSSQGQKLFKAYAQDLIGNEDPAEFNQAIMELGALVCTPKNPDCESCPLQEQCSAYLKSSQLDFPVKSKKTKVTNKYFNFFISSSNQLQIEKRKGKGIWQNMFQLPLIESDKPLTLNDVKSITKKKWNTKTQNKITEYQHILSHQKIHASFWKVDSLITNESEYITVNLDEIRDYPLPRLIDRYLEENHEAYGNS